MRITRIEKISEDKLLKLFQQTRLRGHGQPLIYKDSQLQLLRQVDPTTLYPAQNYLLHSNIKRFHDFHGIFQSHGYDIFSLEGGLLFWVQAENGGEEEGPIPLTPPVVEMSRETDGRVVQLINDGMHRVYTAMQLEKSINIIMVNNVPEKWPYYAYARKTGWHGVEELAELPDNYSKKSYRDPKNYKELFRDFNGVFPGIQKQRKRSNPKQLE